MSLAQPEEPRTLIDELLAEQQRLTAVDRFARQHANGQFHAGAARYRDLIPLSQPQPGQQYAFEVDLDKCTGCKACVSACHSLNGLDEGETWREVGLLFSNDWRHPFQQTITTACHHCVEPGCLNGCPVLAYDKDPVTGIVRHLDDQCIGCQYCVMMCPFDVPKYSAKRGIVRKCDMCANRLAVGEAPACAQACPSEAIRITIVEQSEMVAVGGRGEFLPGAPDPRLTLPTTRYKSQRMIPASLAGADHANVAPANPHLPLVFMLVLTQFSVGSSLAALFVSPAQREMLAALAAVLLGLGIAALHLGRPLQAWRAFLGWRRSWFSREVITFGGYAAISLLGGSLMLAHREIHQPILLGLKVGLALVGVAGVACSAMIYAVTGREFWNGPQCFGRFIGTTLLLGTAMELLFTSANGFAATGRIVALAGAMLIVTAIKLGIEHRIAHDFVDENTPVLTPLNKTAHLLAGRLGVLARTRIVFGVIGGFILPVLLVLVFFSGGKPGIALTLTMLIGCIAGEVLERYLFFRAVAPARMPGGVAS